MIEKIAVYPGSFDPATYGHLDIIHRARRLFDRVIVAVSAHSLKNPAFSVQERVSLLRQALRGEKRVEVDSFDTLLVDYVRRKKAQVLLRGLRAVSDFEYEFQLALMNRKLYSACETIFLMPDEKYTYLSSSLVKEIAHHGGKLKDFVPPFIEAALGKLKV